MPSGTFFIISGRQQAVEGGIVRTIQPPSTLPLRYEKKTAKAKADEEAGDHEPKPGDIRVADGVEYVYAKNKRYLMDPYEPMHVWMRTDMESVVDSGPQQGKEGK